MNQFYGIIVALNAGVTKALEHIKNRMWLQQQFNNPELWC